MGVGLEDPRVGASYACHGCMPTIRGLRERGFVQRKFWLRGMMFDKLEVARLMPQGHVNIGEGYRE